MLAREDGAAPIGAKRVRVAARAILGTSHGTVRCHAHALDQGRPWRSTSTRGAPVELVALDVEDGRRVALDVHQGRPWSPVAPVEGWGDPIVARGARRRPGAPVAPVTRHVLDHGRAVEDVEGWTRNGRPSRTGARGRGAR